MTIPHAPARATATSPVLRGALGGLLAATLAIAAAYGAALLPGDTPAWAAWAMALGVPLALVSTVVLGAARGGHVPRRLLVPFALVGLLLVAGFALALALPGSLGAAEPLLLGLPRRAAIVVYGIGLLPIVVLPIAYALTFDAQTLRPEDLERVRAAGRAARAAADPAVAAAAAPRATGAPLVEPAPQAGGAR